MILISGATGNVGRHLVGMLLDQGVQVRLLVRDEQKVAHLGNRVQRVVGDLNDPVSLTHAMSGVERMYFVTPETHQVRNLLEAAREAGVKYVVKQSTIEADRSLGPGKWHREQEELVKTYSFEWTFLRPTMLMSNVIEWWGATIKGHSAVYFPGGRSRVPPVDPKDVAAVACRVLTSPGHSGQNYELTGPQALSIREMVSIIGESLGKRVRYIDVPPFLASIWMRRFGLPDYVVVGLMETLGALRRSEYAYVTDAVASITGSPPRSFETWCRDNRSVFM
jgi:uncharacterized protein YbjT (DUF2867 family)